jgi:pantetheine-phosphate adenylyltransferase
MGFVGDGTRPGKRCAVYPGSFDPFHLGHENISRRAAELFDELVIAVGFNPTKVPTVTADARVKAIGEVMADLPNVSVVSFSGLAVDYVRSRGASFMVRGIRALADTEYEFSMSLTNSTLAPEIETVFLMADKEFANLSSTLIRQIAQYRGDLTPFLPPAIIKHVRQLMGQ